MTNLFYVYAHKKESTGDVFYIGKGSNRSDRKKTYERANYFLKRSRHWQAIAAKHGVCVEILGEYETENEAFEYEKRMIAVLGKNASGGALCNLTDGGDGHCGFSPSQVTREKLRFAVAREKHPNWGKKLSPETCRKKSVSLSASEKNLRGKKLPGWWKEKISATKVGRLNPMYGRFGAESPVARKVVDIETGAAFDSVKMAAETHGHKMKTLYNWLSGHRKNPTSLRFA